MADGHPGASKQRDVVEVFAALLLALAAVATAWSGYQANRWNGEQRSANYVLAVVLFSVTLFFAGVSTKLDSRRLRVALLGTGWAVLIGTVVWLVTFPVSISL